MLSNGQDSILSYYLMNTILYLEKKIKNNQYLFYCYHLFQKNNIIAYWQLFNLAYVFKKPIIISLNQKNLKKRKIYKNNEINARLWRLNSKNKINSLFKKKIIFIQGHTLSDLMETIIIFFKRYNSLKKNYHTKYINYSKEKNYFSYNLTNYPLIKKKNKKLKITKIINTFYKKEKRINNFKIFYKNTTKTNKTKRPLLIKKLKRADVSILTLKILLPFTYDISNKKILYLRNKIRIYYILILIKLFKNARNQI